MAQALPELVGCRKWTLTAVLALAFMAEMADNSILQALYAPVGRALHASAVQLGTLTMWRGLVQVPVPCCRIGAAVLYLSRPVHVVSSPSCIMCRCQKFRHTSLFCIF